MKPSGQLALLFVFSLREPRRHCWPHLECVYPIQVIRLGNPLIDNPEVYMLKCSRPCEDDINHLGLELINLEL